MHKKNSEGASELHINNTRGKVNKPKEKNSSNNKPEPEKIHILLAEDEDINRTMFTKMLQNLGYTVTPAANGAEALEIYLQQPETFDCVLSDMIMPIMNGLSLAKKLVEHNPKLPILLITGYAEQINIKEIYAIGCNALLSKPIMQKELDAAIRKVVGKKEVRDKSS